MPAELSQEEMSLIRAQAFWRLHEGLPKQGPGSDETTRRALEIVGELPAEPRILDMGCGPGRQTLALARETGGTIVGFDLLPPFLEQARDRVAAAGLGDRVEFRQQSMGDLPVGDYPDACADLIWSEGAIYNIGFEAGLRSWRRLLARGSRAAVSEVTWVGAPPPERVRAWWNASYPGIQDLEENRQAIGRAGYRLVDDFALPDSEWWDDYYSLIEDRLEGLRAERDDDGWKQVVSEFDEELEVVRSGLSSFAYVFYVMERTDST